MRFFECAFAPCAATPRAVIRVAQHVRQNGRAVYEAFSPQAFAGWGAHDIAVLLDHDDPSQRAGTVAAACAFAGLRISETLALTWRDLDFQAETLTVCAQLGADGQRRPLKTAAGRATLPMLPLLARELRAHRSRQAGRDLRRVHADALVFQTASGRPQGRRNALRAVQAAADAAGLNGNGREPVGLHDLRHSFVALALEAGVSIAEAAALARHASPAVTLAVYGGIVEQGREKASAKLVAAGFGR